MSTSMVDVDPFQVDPLSLSLHRSGLVRSSSRIGIGSLALLNRKPSISTSPALLPGPRSGSPRPLGPRDPVPASLLNTSLPSSSSSTESKSKQGQTHLRRHGSPTLVQSNMDALRDEDTFSPAFIHDHERTSSESLPEFHSRSFAANAHRHRQNKKTAPPAPLVLGRSNGATATTTATVIASEKDEMTRPTFLAIPPVQAGRSRRTHALSSKTKTPPEPAASPSATTTLAGFGARSRDRGRARPKTTHGSKSGSGDGLQVITIGSGSEGATATAAVGAGGSGTTKQAETQTSERLRELSQSLVSSSISPPDSGLLGLYPPPPDPMKNTNTHAHGSVGTGATAIMNDDNHSPNSNLNLTTNRDTANTIPTPLTPSFRFAAPTLPTHRRQKLQKLARTLGENVPPSLIFPDWGDERLARPLRSPSLGSGFDFDLEFSSGSGSGSWRGARGMGTGMRPPRSPAKAAWVADEIAKEAEYEYTSNTRSGSGSGSGVKGSKEGKKKKYVRRRSASVGNLFALDLDHDFDHDLGAGLEEVRGKNAKGVSTWRAPSEWANGPAASPAFGSDSSSGSGSGPALLQQQQQQAGMGMKAMARGSAGVWNAADYDVVMDRLRNLRR